MGGAPTLKTKSVKFNFMMNMILTVSSFVFPLITFPYVSRVLLVEGNGYVSFATSVLTYFTMFASLGIPSMVSEHALRLGMTEKSCHVLHKSYSLLILLLQL